MEITEVKVKLVEGTEDKLQAFATVTIDSSFVIRDLKIIDGNNGLFVAMPSRKLTARCESCGAKNYLRASYCSECGKKLKERALAVDEQGRPKLYVDVAHPINSRCREYLQRKVLEQFEKEMIQSKGARGRAIRDDSISNRPHRPARDKAPESEAPQSKAPEGTPPESKTPGGEVPEEKEKQDEKDEREFGMGIFS